MTMLFKETDDIIRLGKWAYLQIPSGERCKKCLMLNEQTPSNHVSWYCGLRPSYGLIHDEKGPFKDTACPRREEVG